MIKVRRVLLGGRLLGAVLAFLALAGCSGSSDLVPVSGKVTLNGSPLPAVRVVFYQPGAGPDRSFHAVTDAQGQYSLTTMQKDDKGVAPGQYTVTLTTAFADNEMQPIPKEQVPREFREQQFEVPPEGTTEANFELKGR